MNKTTTIPKDIQPIVCHKAGDYRAYQESDKKDPNLSQKVSEVNSWYAPNSKLTYTGTTTAAMLKAMNSGSRPVSF